MTSSAKIILDSESPNGDRLTTMEVVFHRFVLAEFNTHRMFSRNSASSRAIPIKKQIAKVQTNPALPLEWGANQPGMQAGEPLTGIAELQAIGIWKQAADHAIDQAEKLNSMGVHKQITNRLLEPFMWHTAVVTSAEWNNFFTQRCSPLAQPEIQAVAYAMRDALNDSKPTTLDYGEWHTPYIQEDEYQLFDLETRKAVSAARCARVSYLTQDGVRDPAKDLELYERLSTLSPPHASPLEHVATPYQEWSDNPLGNFSGWKQLRHIVLGM